MEVHWHHPDLFPEEQRSRVEERLAELARGHRDLIDVRVAARLSGHHRHGGQEVRITCLARGKELVAARTRAEVGQALEEAFDAFEREVWRMRDRRSQRRGGDAEPRRASPGG